MRTQRLGQKGTGPDRMETIEIGTVKLTCCGFTKTGKSASFARPVAEPVLCGICTRLTGIRKQDAATAPSLPEPCG